MTFLAAQLGGGSGGTFFDGATKLEGQEFWAGASSDNVFGVVPVPVGNNLVLTGVLYIGGADAAGTGLSRYEFTATRATDGTIINEAIGLGNQLGAFAPAITATLTGSGPGAADLEIKGTPQAAGDTEFCWALSYDVCALQTHLIPGA